MARKKMRRFSDGGSSGEGDPIIVEGKRNNAMTTFDLARLVGSSGSGGMGPAISGGGGGGSPGRTRGRVAPVAPRPNFSLGKTSTAAGPVIGPRFGNDRFSLGMGLGRGAIGGGNAPIAGVGGSFQFKEGGSAKKKPKKMAKGGSVSSASKRADGCATKGKTKGKMV